MCVGACYKVEEGMMAVPMPVAVGSGGNGFVSSERDENENNKIIIN